VSANTGISEPDALEDRASNDPYLLRGLLWCGLDGRPLVTVLLSNGKRAYSCANVVCAGPMLDGATIDELVWQRFWQLNEAAAEAMEQDRRQAALREVLKRITVHSDPSELEYEWRD